MQAYHTSLRSRSAEETLRIAKLYASRYGITRVTETTRLDKIGVPVCASIRPDASLSSLCVCAGKGLLPIEARVGAYMEAIEFALSDPRYSQASYAMGKVKDVLDVADRPESILDFCPKMGVDIGLDDLIAVSEAEELIHGGQSLVPSELVFMPFDPPSGLARLFGSHTNGLASGNNLEEATLHGTLEVVERDILSFRTVDRRSVRVLPDSYPPLIKEIDDKIRQAGLELIVNWVPSAWELPFFAATLLDTSTMNPMYINAGYGCHFRKSIAMMRAVTEAIQSRMTFIHGGRDDVIDDYRRFAGLTEIEKAARFKKSAAHYRQFETAEEYDSIPEPAWQFPSVEAYLRQLLSHLHGRGIDHVLRVAHTQKSEEIQVVKVIVPKLEFFTAQNTRLGPRLRDHAQKMTDDFVRRT